jgi:hypothetical protein
MRFLAAALLIAAALVSCARVTLPQPDPFERLPDIWVDLPAAPFVARLVGPKAILVNRSKHTFDTVVVGCVLERNGHVVVVSRLMATEIFDSRWRPRDHVEGLLASINVRLTPEYQQRYGGQPDAMKACPAEATGIAVVSASMRGAEQWAADGTPWPPSR